SPDRVAAAVCQDPVGLVEGFNDRATFWAMFEPTVNLASEQGMTAVVEAAMENPLFLRNQRAGPFAARLAVDADFRAEVSSLAPGEYVAIIEQWDEQIWGAEGPFVSVPESFVATCDTPMLVLPGSDQFHPTATAERLCAEARGAMCLPVDCRADAERRATTDTIRDFLRAHSDR
ncbi:MAG: hypothetical protein OEU32_19255, partial [Acidimicrobiia bacterium]|nr:hypothetical protein [Acidimicrobiia bacterium]